MEGVCINENGDTSYEVTDMRIQEVVEAAANELLSNYINKMQSLVDELPSLIESVHKMRIEMEYDKALFDRR